MILQYRMKLNIGFSGVVSKFTLLDIFDSLKLIERGVIQKDTRYIVRAMRSVQKLRKKTCNTVLWKLVNVTWMMHSTVQF